MKKIILIGLGYIITILGFEVLLRNSDVYTYILRNSSYVEWTNGYTNTPNNWTDVLIMGSSLARGAINNQQMQQEFQRHKIFLTVGHIGVPSNSHANDYFTLQRIVSTCQKCPKTIILSLTDLALRKQELDWWMPITKKRIIENYILGNENERVLAQAASYDPGYIPIKQEIFLLKDFRIYFVGKHLLVAGKSQLAKWFHLPEKSKVLVKTQQISDPGYGFWPYEQKLSHADLRIVTKTYEDLLQNYEPGGSGKMFLEEFIELAQKHHITVVLVLMPLSDIYQKQFPKVVADHKHLVAEITKKKSVLLLDTTQFHSNEYSLYSDSNHLNKYGAKLYTPKLVDTLVDILGNRINRL